MTIQHESAWSCSRTSENGMVRAAGAAAEQKEAVPKTSRPPNDPRTGRSSAEGGLRPPATRADNRPAAPFPPILFPETKSHRPRARGHAVHEHNTRTRA